MITPTEGLVAIGMRASVGFITSVSPDVNSEGTAMGERFRTVSTLERFFPCVSPHVLGQSGLRLLGLLGLLGLLRVRVRVIRVIRVRVSFIRVRVRVIRVCISQF
jgi:hypothetical protein